MLIKLANDSVTAVVFGLVLLGTSALAVAEPTQVTKIRGKTLIVYKEAIGAPLKKIPAADVSLPLDIKDDSPKGRYQVEIDGEILWIRKAQAVTDEKVADPGSVVSCQSITTSYASSRGFSDCKE